MRSMVDSVVRVLDQVAIDPQVRLSGLDILDGAEWDSVVESWNDTAAESPECTVPELVAAQAELTPDAPAVIGSDTVLTYVELDARADRVAGWLAARGG